MKRLIAVLAAAVLLVGSATGCGGSPSESPCLAGSQDPKQVTSTLLYGGDYKLVETNKPTYIHITGNIIETSAPVGKADFTYDLDKVEPIGGTASFNGRNGDAREVNIGPDVRQVIGRPGETLIILALCAKRKKS